MPEDGLHSDTWDAAIQTCREKQTDSTIAILHILAEAASDLANTDLQYALKLAIENAKG